jgi:hypothetical protein
MQFYSAKLYSSLTSALHANSGPIEVWEKNLLFLCKDLDTASKMVQKRGSSESFSLDEISWLPDESPMMSQYEGFRELCCISSVSVNEQGKASLPAGCIVSTSIFEFENTSSTGIEFEQQFQSSNFKYYGESSRQKLTILDPPFLDDLSLAMQQHLNMNLEVVPSIWCGAHLLFQVIEQKGPLLDSTIFFDILISIGGSSRRAVLQKAKKLGCFINDHLIAKTIDFALEFVGIRDMIEIDNVEIGRDFSDLPPTHLSEISLTKYRCPAVSALKQLVNDEDAKLQLAQRT